MASEAPANSALEVEHARRIAERLRSEFSMILRALPPELRTIAGMAAELDVPRPTCQRLLRAMRSRGLLVQSLTYYPGVRGLQQFVDAAKRKGFEESTIAGAEAALRQFADLTTDCGGSQARLNAAIEEALREREPATSASDAATMARQRAFESTRQLTKRSFDTQLALYIYRPVKGSDELIHSVTAMGMIGMERHANAQPLCIVSSSVPRDEEQSQTVESLPGLSGLPISVVPDFSSAPVPQLSVRRQPGRVTVLTEMAPDARSDLVLARRFSEIRHPALDDPPQQFCWMLSDGPSRNLVMQVFMHRSMARASIPSADAYFVGNRGIVGGMQQNERGETYVELPAFRWFDRLADGPRLEQLGAGLQHANHACYPRLGDLTKELFHRHDWDPAEFVGVRCHVRYPVWGAQYLIAFDFARDDELEE
jgi:hypothetical protein